MMKRAFTKYDSPSPEELEILNNFKQKPFHDFGISEIMDLSKKKSKPWVFNVLKGFEKCGLVVKKRKGNREAFGNGAPLWSVN